MVVMAKTTSQKIGSLLCTSLAAPDYAGFEKGLKDMGQIDDHVLKMLMEVAFRQHLTARVVTVDQMENPNLDQCHLLVTFSINAVRSGLCTPTLPIVLLSDMFDLLPLSHCENLFDCVEQNVSTWKEEAFFTPVRNHLLRICNDLLRRLSRSQNTVFCGRILVFLAKYFPISERSGLNIVSEFNLDNNTVFGAEDVSVKTDANDDEHRDQDAILIEDDRKNLNVDYALYKKFWLLQDFFRNPTQCYERLKWKTFTTYARDVMNTFDSFKLDSVAGKKRQTEGASNSDKQYFAKYLTNQNLLQLQLSDSNFRRYILVQYLILFQYLQSSVKFKSDTEVLSDEQCRWLGSATERVNKLMRETPPDGEAFSRAVGHILLREQQWNAWKNDGCPEFDRAKKANEKRKAEAEATDEDKKPSIALGSRKRKRCLADQISTATSKGKFLMGNPNLTRLWNVCPDNLEACAAPERDFLPSVEEYFDEAIEQLKPENQVEAEYRKINDGAWGWRALRLMAKKSPHFFTYGNHPIAKLPEYLEQMLKKMSKDSSFNLNSSGGSISVGNTVTPFADEGTNGNSASPVVCSSESLAKLAGKLGSKWKDLLPKLGLDEEVKAEIEKEEAEDKDRALRMFTKWSEMEGEGATEDELLYVLEGLKMKELAEGIFPTVSAS